MKTLLVPLSQIKLGSRIRVEMGDLDSLAESIGRVGIIQPLVINQDNVLVAGGRRFAAAQQLKLDHVPVVYRETLSVEDLKELELEENLHRKDLTWQERALQVADLHQMKCQRNALEGQRWGLRQTGEMLNMSLGKVQYIVELAQRLRAEPDGPVAKAESVMDGIRLLAKEGEQAAAQELANRTMASVYTGESDDMPVIPLSDGEVAPPIAQGDMLVPLSNFVYNVDCIAFMTDVLPANSVDHIITDPPYGIDMAMLAQEGTGMSNIDNVAAEHIVEDNIALYRRFIPNAARVVRPGGFIVMWCDIMQWQLLYDLCKANGLSVQRWPLVWYKLHPCINQAAQFNFTKNFEIAMVCRKGTATLIEPSPSSVVSASNDTEQRKFGHPFVKPAAVWEFILQHVAMQGQLIYEPFAGVGSGVLTMLQHGYRVIANEVVPTHFNNLVINVQDHYRAINPNVKFT